MNLLNRLKERLLYNPYKAVARAKSVQMGDSKLAKSFRIRFDCPRHDLALTIGDNCLLRNHFVFESDRGRVTVGDGTFINSGTMVISRSSIAIGKSVTIAWGCVIYDHDSHSLFYQDRIADHDQQMKDLAQGNMLAHKNWMSVSSKPITIHDHVWLGFDVLVLKGVTIGEGAVIGARSVVTKDIPAWTVAAGNPAKVVKEIPHELRRL